MASVRYSEDFGKTKVMEYPSLQEAIDAYTKCVDWGTASWSRRIEIRDEAGKRVALKWFVSPTRKEWTLEQTLKRVKDLGGMEAVDNYLDLQEPTVPWEFCYDCEEIMPRNPETLKCVFLEDHE
jgi:hypothetical protein